MTKPGAPRDAGLPESIPPGRGNKEKSPMVPNQRRGGGAGLGVLMAHLASAFGVHFGTLKLLLRDAGGLANSVPPLVLFPHECPKLRGPRAVHNHADCNKACAHFLIGNDFA
jgi:hypothetical protein